MIAVSNLLLRKLLKATTKREVLALDKLDPAKRANYAREAEMIYNTELYKHLISDLNFRSHEIMFTKSKSFDDMFFGKAMLYNTDLIVRTINILRDMNIK